jgi:hypothetical protein
VLFWAEIYHQARSMPTASLRPIFVAFNALVYACQVRPAAHMQQQRQQPVCVLELMTDTALISGRSVCACLGRELAFSSSRWMLQGSCVPCVAIMPDVRYGVQHSAMSCSEHVSCSPSLATPTAHVSRAHVWYDGVATNTPTL